MDAAGCLARLGGLADRLAACQADAERAAAHRRALGLAPVSDDALQGCASAARPHRRRMLLPTVQPAAV